jgi:hypothetical protein
MDAGYYIHCFDGARDVWIDSIEAASDAEALGLAERLDRAVVKEVWQGSRLVASLHQDPSRT